MTKRWRQVDQGVGPPKFGGDSLGGGLSRSRFREFGRMGQDPLGGQIQIPGLSVQFILVPAQERQRRSLIGSGDRSEKIRTYNFPQSRVTDHRVNLTSHNLEGILDGALHDFTETLQTTEMEERLAASGLNA